MKYPELVINKRATVNPKIRDNKLFQYSTIVALNHENIEIHLKRISNIESFIDQYNWEGTEFPAGVKHWEKFERNNKIFDFNLLFVPHN